MSYFSSDHPADADLSIVRAADRRTLPIAEGITIEPVLGERLNINVVVLEPHAIAAAHTHAEEQMGYVVSGSCDFTDGTRTWRLQPGDTYHAPPGAPHGATAHEEGCIIIDAFSPPRAGLREMLED